MKDDLRSYLIRSSIIGTAVILGLLFIPAGTFRYWQGWAYIGTFAVCSWTYTAYLANYDPALLERRTQAGISYESELTQKVVMLCLYAVCIALVVLPPLDVRFGWSAMPWYVSVFGNVLVVFSFYIFYLVAKVNTYAAGNVRVEQGQKVISEGPYAFVRHPMYFGALFLLAGTPLALGSWWGLLMIPPSLLILYFRLSNEEAVLLRELKGYNEYTCKVRYRLIPGVF